MKNEYDIVPMKSNTNKIHEKLIGISFSYKCKYVSKY